MSINSFEYEGQKVNITPVVKEGVLGYQVSDHDGNVVEMALEVLVQQLYRMLFNYIKEQI